MKILGIKTEKRHTGNLGERYAALYLFLHGYRIIKRNYVADDAEIDIIAKKKNLIAFVEVKAQTVGHENQRKPRPASAVNQEKQQKIIKAAKNFSKRGYNETKKRFDVIEVYLKKTKFGRRPTKINHIVGAFDLNLAYAKGRR